MPARKVSGHVVTKTDGSKNIVIHQVYKQKARRNNQRLYHISEKINVHHKIELRPKS